VVPPRFRIAIAEQSWAPRRRTLFVLGQASRPLKIEHKKTLTFIVRVVGGRPELSKFLREEMEAIVSDHVDFPRYNYVETKLIVIQLN